MADEIKKNGLGKLTEQDIKFIRQEWSRSGYMPFYLAKQFGVSKMTIYRWCKTEEWREYQNNWVKAKKERNNVKNHH